MAISRAKPVSTRSAAHVQPAPTKKIDFAVAWVVGCKSTTKGLTLQLEPGDGKTAWVRVDSKGKFHISEEKPGAAKSSERLLTAHEKSQIRTAA